MDGHNVDTSLVLISFKAHADLLTVVCFAR